MSPSSKPPRPSGFEERYRLYLDESGDHVFRKTTGLAHRFLCLLGCWFKNPDYLQFHQSLESLKAKHLPHHPDDPVVLHREDMLNARRAFKRHLYEDRLEGYGIVLYPKVLVQK